MKPKKPTPEEAARKAARIRNLIARFQPASPTQTIQPHKTNTSTK